MVFFYLVKCIAWVFVAIYAYSTSCRIFKKYKKINLNVLIPALCFSYSVATIILSIIDILMLLMA